MGTAVSTVYYNLKLRHPTIDIPNIDYDLAVLIQPMLMLGISIGVAFNVIFADWMEAAKRLEADGNGTEAEYKLLPGGPSNSTENEAKVLAKPRVSILEDVRWKELGLLIFVWMAFLALQIIKNYTATCSAIYWAVNLLQIPVSLGVSGYESICLYKGWRKIASTGDGGSNLKVHQLITYFLLGVLAGMIGGLLGVGGGSIMCLLFLEFGVPPQVSSRSF
ncbi:unnamed protein product [Fraxinus pennsylvanica]|uniref:Sulfite exporter TauE/SafE family protein n=1 Tax=Fraxinus pennsylvanica TaxID=56036 RepID=A0AAD2ED06_9LAMI|nr:unnamed protein product [Fraxinus pennsylvanica]